MYVLFVVQIQMLFVYLIHDGLFNKNKTRSIFFLLKENSFFYFAKKERKEFDILSLFCDKETKQNNMFKLEGLYLNIKDFYMQNNGMENDLRWCSNTVVFMSHLLSALNIKIFDHCVYVLEKPEYFPKSGEIWQTDNKEISIAEKHVNMKDEYKNVIICNDILKDGENEAQLAKLFKEKGFNIIGFLFIYEMKELNGRKKLNEMFGGEENIKILSL